MGKVQIVIELYKLDYESIKENDTIFDDDIEDVAKAIKNGVVLPKNHGRLIDEKDLSLLTVHMIDGMFICDAPTIIEGSESE